MTGITCNICGGDLVTMVGSVGMVCDTCYAEYSDDGELISSEYNETEDDLDEEEASVLGMCFPQPVRGKMGFVDSMGFDTDYGIL